MAKRMFAMLVLALTVGSAASHAEAQIRLVALDGCAKLARVVYSEVSAAAIYGPGRSGPWVIGGSQGEISVCRSAAKTVSQAFTSALLTTGIDIGWRNGGSGPEDFCLSAFLSQCYPRSFPYSTAQAIEDSFVQSSWAIVSRAVMQEMYNPISSNEVHFRDHDLKLRIGLSLRSLGTLDGREHPAR